MRKVARFTRMPTASLALSANTTAAMVRAAKVAAQTRQQVKLRAYEDSTSVRIVGIDPGEHMGLAFFCDGALTGMSESSPVELIDVLDGFLQSRVALVVFEDSRKQSSVWTAQGSMAQRQKMARNVGEIDAWCRLIEGRCDRLGIPCLGLAPSEKAGSATGKKLSEEAFRHFTGWKGERTNQHKRDAALVAWAFRGCRP